MGSITGSRDVLIGPLGPGQPELLSFPADMGWHCHPALNTKTVLSLDQGGKYVSYTENLNPKRRLVVL